MLTTLFRCINNIISFLQPILDAVSEATGWAVTLMAGGPEPADGGWLFAPGYLGHRVNLICLTGRLNVINLHGGASADCVGLSFGSAMRIPYKHAVLPVFGQFLKLCYSKFFVAVIDKR